MIDTTELTHFCEAVGGAIRRGSLAFFPADDEPHLPPLTSLPPTSVRAFLPQYVEIESARWATSGTAQCSMQVLHITAGEGRSLMPGQTDAEQFRTVATELWHCCRAAGLDPLVRVYNQRAEMIVGWQLRR